MSAVLEANIARALSAVEEKTWEPNCEVTLERLRIVDMMHEDWPRCRLCGQTVNRLDAAGLCSKTSASHQERRGLPVPKKKAGAQS